MHINKKILGVIIICLVFFGFSFVDAISLDIITNPVEAIMKAVATIVVTSAITLFKIGTGFLSYIITNGFTGANSFGADQLLLDFGWAVVRDIANIVIALAFVIVGLGIILGWQNYEAKKAMPILIVIALLINFTPAICGFIIDISNALIASFLNGGISYDLFSTDKAVEAIQEQDAMGAMVWAITMALFTLGGFIICILYALLFIVRYFALWVLIIISPIAFASRAIPQGKIRDKIFAGVLGWDEWWNRFIEWCVIGVTSAFFLYLGTELVMNMADTLDFNFLDIATYFQIAMPFVFLYIGFFIALETSSSGGVGQSINALKQSSVYKNTYGKAYNKTREKVISTGQKTGGTVKGAGQGLAVRTSHITGVDKKMASARRSWHNAKEFTTGDYGKYNQEQAAKISKQQEQFKGRTDDDLKKMWDRKGGGLTERVALAQEAVNRGKFDKIGIKTSDMKPLISHGLDVKNVIKKRPEYAADFGKNIRETVQGMKNKDFLDISAESYKDPRTIWSMNERQCSYILKNGSQEQIRNAVRTLKQLKNDNGHMVTANHECLNDEKKDAFFKDYNATDIMNQAASNAVKYDEASFLLHG